MKHSRKNSEARTLIMMAKVISTLFRPIYYPVVCCGILLVVTPLSRLPWQYKIMEMCIMMVFTIAMPLFFTACFRRFRHISRTDMRKRSNRIVPYLMTIMCYSGYLFLMRNAYMPYLLFSVISAALLIQIVCTLLSLVWKVSVHSAGSGAMIGAIAAYSQIFQFNPLAWMSVAIMIAGLVGTSRMILRQHSLSQIVVGTLIGIVCGYFGIAWGILIYGA